MHSESYLWRRNNPHNRNKSEGEHISHFTKRIKERFDLDITLQNYYSLIEKIQTSDCVYIYALNSSNGIYSVEFEGKTMWILYGAKSKDLPARLKTVLLPHDGFIVPDCISHAYNHKDFTKMVTKTVQQIKQLSSYLDLNDKKSFFMMPISSFLKKGALRYKQNGEDSILMLYSLAIKHIISQIIETPNEQN